MRAFLSVLCLLAMTACDEGNPTGPRLPLNEQFRLAPGEVVQFEGATPRLQFVGVTGDSRCPADAVCIQGGDALVHVRVVDGGSISNYELHTGDSSKASVAHEDLLITLVELQPYPFSSRPTDPSEYRATLVVRR